MRDESRPGPSSSLIPHPSSLLLDLHLDDDFGWDDGLICGGSAQIFIQPLTTHHASPAEVYQAAIALKADRRRGMLAMVVAAPSPAEPPAGCRR